MPLWCSKRWRPAGGTICDWAEAAAATKDFCPIKARNVERTRARWREIGVRMDALGAKTRLRAAVS